MNSAQPKPLRRPGRDGFVGPSMATAVLDRARAAWGEAAMTDLMKAAKLYHPINANDPLREAKAAGLHRALRETRGAEANALLAEAGREAGEMILNRQLTSRAQNLLKSGPWTISAWMLSRALGQNAWLFAGSGEFTVADGMCFEIRGNPLIRGESSPVPLCTFHAALFETIYRALVDARLSCIETTCEAAGDEACRFSFGLSEE